MTPAERIEQKTKKNANRRQINHRQRQRGKGLLRLQTRISRYAHSKATLLSQTEGKNLTQIYELAILDQATSDREQLPTPHIAVVNGELFGTMAIDPWMPTSTVQKLDEIIHTGKYRNRIMAMSALVSAYCDKVM